jgi:ABC-type nitrate/sulfonate/bicarbonate transport system permease component
VAEPKGPGGMSKALNAAWIRPFLVLIFIVVAWDLTIRLFRIPPYQIPARPGAIAAIYDVPLPRPRSLDAMAEPVFAELAQRIRKHFFTQSALD